MRSEQSPGLIELGEGIRAACRASPPEPCAGCNPGPAREAKADLSSLSSMLKARWKGNAPAPSTQPEPLQVGQIRTFRIVKLDRETLRRSKWAGLVMSVRTLRAKCDPVRRSGTAAGDTPQM